MMISAAKEEGGRPQSKMRLCTNIEILGKTTTLHASDAAEILHTEM